MSMPPAGEVGGALDPGFWGAYPSPAPASFTPSACSSTTQTEALQAAYNSSQQELGFYSRPPSRRARASTRVSGRLGAPWQVASGP
jgi:hypothetical protein